MSAQTNVVLPGEPIKPVLVKNNGSGNKSNDKKGPVNKSPFKQAKAVEKKIKLFVYGDSGVGKTTLALQFPSPVVIDLEAGTDLYGSDYNFDVLKANTIDEVMEAIDWLYKNKHSYKTLVIDPITVYWDALQKKWSETFLNRNKQSRGYKFEYYNFQPIDWQTIKSELKYFLRRLTNLDMHIVVTAREKTKYKDGQMMASDGETFDGEKSLPYMFDTVIRLYKNQSRKHMAICLKDRSKKLPLETEFESSYDVIKEAFGEKSMQKAVKQVLASEEQKKQILEYCTRMSISKEDLERKLINYDSSSLDDLSFDNAQLIITKLNTVN